MKNYYFALFAIFFILSACNLPFFSNSQDTFTEAGDTAYKTYVYVYMYPVIDAGSYGIFTNTNTRSVIKPADNVYSKLDIQFHLINAGYMSDYLDGYISCWEMNIYDMSYDPTNSILNVFINHNDEDFYWSASLGMNYQCTYNTGTNSTNYYFDWDTFYSYSIIKDLRFFETNASAGKQYLIKVSCLFSNKSSPMVYHYYGKTYLTLE